MYTLSKSNKIYFLVVAVLSIVVFVAISEPTPYGIGGLTGRLIGLFLIPALIACGSRSGGVAGSGLGRGGTLGAGGVVLPLLKRVVLLAGLGGAPVTGVLGLKQILEHQFHVGRVGVLQRIDEHLLLLRGTGVELGDHRGDLFHQILRGGDQHRGSARIGHDHHLGL